MESYIINFFIRSPKDYLQNIMLILQTNKNKLILSHSMLELNQYLSINNFAENNMFRFV